MNPALEVMDRGVATLESIWERVLRRRCCEIFSSLRVVENTLFVPKCGAESMASMVKGDQPGLVRDSVEVPLLFIDGDADDPVRV